MTSTMNIERTGKTTGRWAKYRLVVNGVELGQVARTMTKTGGDKYVQQSNDGWRIHGTICPTQAEAEQTLIDRAVRFGMIQK